MKQLQENWPSGLDFESSMEISKLIKAITTSGLVDQLSSVFELSFHDLQFFIEIKIYSRGRIICQTGLKMLEYPFFGPCSLLLGQSLSDFEGSNSIKRSAHWCPLRPPLEHFWAFQLV